MKSKVHVPNSRKRPQNFSTPRYLFIMTFNAGTLLIHISLYIASCIVEWVIGRLWMDAGCPTDEGACFILFVPGFILVPVLSGFAWFAALDTWGKHSSPSIPSDAYAAASILGFSVTASVATTMKARRGVCFMTGLSFAMGGLAGFCILENRLGIITSIIRGLEASDRGPPPN
ncbi:uncharacterized protein F5Z01DRAFT_151318 [Emericellopsis atlantica]|uniref:Uncharacterized protein n=1 Tax=Emericellopsis atlantica TaxID=2614577 RepID=A0A9P8CNY7_9HYPO|nr:uncharacterized protein F5Z01DRAFT_151318 [Emericellopsis atlantica]KAG9253632.1 hypothetical protein F5Z01DRAFT_151318 [Emericellopsis atlantica]